MGLDDRDGFRLDSATDGLGRPSHHESQRNVGEASMALWNLPAPPGFQGLVDELPLGIYVRHLPHWRQAGATYFVTFRLADSLPQVKLDELKQLRQEWDQRHPKPWTTPALEELAKETMRRVERWLDQGMGSSLMKNPTNAAHLVDSLSHFDDTRYELGAYVVMPNLVHAIVRPLQWKRYPLEKLIGAWKQYSSTRIGKGGQLWQDECYDRIIRDEEHLYRCLIYIGDNPKRAGLSRAICPAWVNPRWVVLGWKFNPE